MVITIAYKIKHNETLQLTHKSVAPIVATINWGMLRTFGKIWEGLKPKHLMCPQMESQIRPRPVF